MLLLSFIAAMHKCSPLLLFLGLPIERAMWWHRLLLLSACANTLVHVGTLFTGRRSDAHEVGPTVQGGDAELYNGVSMHGMELSGTADCYMKCFHFCACRTACMRSASTANGRTRHIMQRPGQRCFCAASLCLRKACGALYDGVENVIPWSRGQAIPWYRGQAIPWYRGQANTVSIMRRHTCLLQLRVLHSCKLRDTCCAGWLAAALLALMCLAAVPPISRRLLSVPISYTLLGLSVGLLACLHGFVFVLVAGRMPYHIPAVAALVLDLAARLASVNGAQLSL
jgi:hypothetical protein